MNGEWSIDGIPTKFDALRAIRPIDAQLCGLAPASGPEIGIVLEHAPFPVTKEKETVTLFTRFESDRNPAHLRLFACKAE